MTEPTGIFLTKSYDAFVTYNDWRLLYYLELDEFYNDIERFNECVDKMKSLCSDIPEKEQCSYLVERFEAHKETIKQNVEYIEGFQRKKQNRRRRAPLQFFITYIYKPIFGLLDEDDATNFNNKINSLIGSDEKHTLLIEESMSLIKQTIQTFNMTLEDFRSNIDQLNTQLTNVITESNTEIMNHINIEYFSSIATLIIMEHEKTLKTLKQTLRNALNGDFSEIITNNQFKKDLEIIAKHLDPELFIITANHIDAQSITSIKSTLIDRRILIEFKVPLIQKSPYKLTKITTLPISINNRTIFIDTKNMEYLVNNKKMEYIPMSDTEIQKCKKLTNHDLICFPQTESFLKKEKICESDIIFGTEINNILKKCNYKYVKDTNYVKHLEENTYYIFTTTSINITEICSDKRHKNTSVSSIGILTMSPNCEVILDNIKISTRNTETSTNITKIETPYKFSKLSPQNIRLLSTKTKKIEMPKLNYLDHNQNFQELINIADEKIDDIQKMELINYLEYLDSHEIERYATRIIMILFFILLVIVMIKRCC